MLQNNSWKFLAAARTTQILSHFIHTDLFFTSLQRRTMFLYKINQLQTLKFYTFLTLLLCIYLLLLLSIFGANAKQSSTVNKNFKCNETEFERCLNRQLMLGDRSFVFPVNGKQVNRRCK